MAELKQLWENDRLEFHGSAAPYKNYYTFKELLNTCYAVSYTHLDVYKRQPIEVNIVESMLYINKKGNPTK